MGLGVQVRPRGPSARERPRGGSCLGARSTRALGLSGCPWAGRQHAHCPVRWSQSLRLPGLGEKGESHQVISLSLGLGTPWLEVDRAGWQRRAVGEPGR